MDIATTLAPLSSAQAFENLLKQVDSALSHGARLVIGGKRMAGEAGNFMQPTILADISANNPAYK